MCSYSDKNIEPNFLEKIKNMKKCWNLENLRTTEPQKNLLVLIKKMCTPESDSNFSQCVILAETSQNSNPAEMLAIDTKCRVGL